MTHPFMTADEHTAGLARVEQIIDAAPGTPEAVELDTLVDRIVQFEEIEWPIAAPTAAHAYAFRMEQEAA